MRDSVLIYRSQIDALRGLPPEQFKNVLLAISDYAMDGTVPDGDPVTVAMWAMAKPIIDKNNKRYEVGKTGGRPENQTYENENQTDETENQTEPTNNQTVTKPNQTEPNDNLKVKGERIKDKDNNCSFTDVNESTRRRVVEAWNTLEPLGITPVRAITAESKRGQMLNARLRQYGEQVIVDSIASVKDQPFLHGQAWFTFDWFIKPNNFLKVYEGNYKGVAKSATKNTFTNFEHRSDNASKYAALEQMDNARHTPPEDYAALEAALLGR